MQSRLQQVRRSPTLQTDRFARQLQRDRLKVVVLGPGEAQPHDLNKRKQIARRLRSYGYSRTVLGEDLLGEATMPLHLALQSELPAIDLLLVLNTGVAPIVELASISSDYRARQITKVWSKREFTEGRRTTPSDVVEMFDNWPFSAEEFYSCELVESFIATAERFCMSKAQREGRLTALGLPPPS